MEIDLTMILPEFDGLESISPKGRKAIENAHRKLAELAGRHRRSAYDHGEHFKKIRDTMEAEGQGESWMAYCRAVEINSQTFRDCIYIFEAFAGQYGLLQMFPLTVQRMISRPSMRHLLPQALELASGSKEVTRAWYDDQLGVATQKRMPPPDDDLDDDEEADVEHYLNGDDDEEEDTIPIERTKEFKDSLLANTLAIEDPEEARDELCKILIADVQTMKKRLSTFVHQRKVYGGRWYGDLEKSLDQLMAGIEVLQRTQIVHTGE